MTICLALAVSVTTWNVSPTSGRESRPEDFDRHGRPGFSNLPAAIVEHGADASEDRADDEVVADP